MGPDELMSHLQEIDLFANNVDSDKEDSPPPMGTPQMQSYDSGVLPVNETIHKRMDSYRPARYNLTIDHSSFLTPRLFYSLRLLYRNAGVKIERALGPSDFHISDDWKAAEYESKMENMQSPLMQSWQPQHDNAVSRKLGPIEIGRAEGFEAAEYDLPELPDFLAWRPFYTRPNFDPNAKAEKKLGPLDIGRALDFDAAEYDYETCEDFLAERFAYRSRQMYKDLERKLGPIALADWLIMMLLNMTLILVGGLMNTCQNINIKILDYMLKKLLDLGIWGKWMNIGSEQNLILAILNMMIFWNGNLYISIKKLVQTICKKLWIKEKRELGKWVNLKIGKGQNMMTMLIPLQIFMEVHMYQIN